MPWLYILFPEKKKDPEIKKEIEEKEFGQLKPLINNDEFKAQENTNDRSE